ncbi:MAG: class I SAM-dependent methyltransferase [Deltaproteobacteria bacterium]|nr:class I SAM-dependent methyltransferase [Deltaproteobacteria bacterium]
MMHNSPKLESLILDLRDRVLELAPDMMPVFDVYANEARFGASVIEPDLFRLPSGGRVLEIGGGMMLLSCHLQREGYAVTSVEPVGQGFSHFHHLRGIVLDRALRGGFGPALVSIRAEELEFDSEFDYAFSINVMEHVADVAMVLRRALSAVRPGGRYRFLCPNYAFPYEPHFNIPTLISKKWTKRLMGKWIRSSQAVLDPEGTWMSLNWISVPEVRRICIEELGLEPVFDRSILCRFVQRAVHDHEFQSRRGGWIPRVIRGLDRLGATKLCMKVPVVCQPAMDCAIVRV